jgi:hypothetical protein
MRISTPFQIKLAIRDADFSYVPITFRCRTCKGLEKAIIDHNLLLLLGGAQLDCYKCSPHHWQMAFEAVGQDARDNRRNYKRIRLTANGTPA